MAWDNVPTKLASYREMEYGGDEQADLLIRQFGILSDDDLDMIPAYRRAEFEEKLDYRIGACVQLDKSVGWSPDMLRKV